MAPVILSAHKGTANEIDTDLTYGFWKSICVAN